MDRMVAENDVRQCHDEPIIKEEIKDSFDSIATNDPTLFDIISHNDVKLELDCAGGDSETCAIDYNELNIKEEADCKSDNVPYSDFDNLPVQLEDRESDVKPELGCVVGDDVYAASICTAEENSFKCYHCDKCFTHKKYLKQHVKIHTGEKPFKCDHCEKCFIQQSNLKQHTMIHT
ncbi:unnamed protein product, partial [Owenia fusiformis]